VVVVLEPLVVVVLPAPLVVVTVPGLVVVVTVPGLVVVVVPDLGGAVVVVVVVVCDFTKAVTRWAAGGLGTEAPFGTKASIHSWPLV
jgi:hypothetical protein